MQTSDRRQRLRERLETLRWTLAVGSGAAFGVLWLMIAPAAASATQSSQSLQSSQSAQSSQPANGSASQDQPAYQAPAPQQQVGVPQPYQPPVLRTRRS